MKKEMNILVRRIIRTQILKKADVPEIILNNEECLISKAVINTRQAIETLIDTEIRLAYEEHKRQAEEEAFYVMSKEEIDELYSNGEITEEEVQSFKLLAEEQAQNISSTLTKLEERWKDITFEKIKKEVHQVLEKNDQTSS